MKRVSITRVNSALKCQTAQVAAGDDVRDDVEIIEPWGLTGVAPDAPADGRGAEGILTELNDCPDHAVVFSPGDRRYRPTDIQKGESCLWDADGQRVHLSKTGVKIKAKSGLPVEVEGTAGIKLKNDTAITGTADASTGFATAGTPGKTCIVTIPTPTGPAVLTFMGGLYVSCSGTAVEGTIPTP